MCLPPSPPCCSIGTLILSQNAWSKVEEGCFEKQHPLRKGKKPTLATHCFSLLTLQSIKLGVGEVIWSWIPPNLLPELPITDHHSLPTWCFPTSPPPVHCKQKQCETEEMCTMHFISIQRRMGGMPNHYSPIHGNCMHAGNCSILQRIKVAQ